MLKGTKWSPIDVRPRSANSEELDERVGYRSAENVEYTVTGHAYKLARVNATK